jgi:hypothetical protein
LRADIFIRKIPQQPHSTAPQEKNEFIDHGCLLLPPKSKSILHGRSCGFKTSRKLASGVL